LVSFTQTPFRCTSPSSSFPSLSRTEGTALDAAAQGAIQGVIMVGCVIANIIAFVSFVNFLNAVIGWFGARIGLGYLSFEYLLGKVFVPVAWIMGVDPEECETVALLLGLKTVANEFIAYQRLVKTALSVSKVIKNLFSQTLFIYSKLIFLVFSLAVEQSQVLRSAVLPMWDPWGFPLGD